MFEEAKVVLVEDVQDSNPNLYVERAEEALKNGRYEDALKEIDQAISFSDRQVNYKYEKVKILFSIGKYYECYNIIQKEVLIKRQELSENDNEQLDIYIAKCYRKCNINPNDAPMIILTSDGEGMYSSISEAIKANINNKKIYLTRGVYKEKLVINKSISIEGNNATIQTDGVDIHFGDITLSNLKITCLNDYSEEMITIRNNSSVLIDNCNVRSDSDNLLLANEGKLIIKSSTINCGYGKGSRGILANEGKLIIESSTINCEYGIGSRGILANEGKLIIKSSIINCGYGKSRGIYLYSGSNTEIIDSEIARAETTIYIFKNAKCIINYSQIKNGIYGIVSEGDLQIISSKIDGNKVGIIAKDGNIEISKSTIANNKNEGIITRKTPIFKIESSNIKGNENGIVIEDGDILIDNCDFYGNSKCGINSLGKNIKVKNSSSYDNGNAGVYCYKSGSMIIDNSKIYCNKAPNICVSDYAEITINNTSITSSSEEGVYAYDNGRCTLNHCEIAKNSEQGTNTNNGGVIKTNSCNIHDNESIIGALSGIRRFFRGI